MVWEISILVIILCIYLIKTRFKGNKAQAIANIFSIEAMVFALAFCFEKNNIYSFIAMICLALKLLIDGFYKCKLKGKKHE